MPSSRLLALAALALGFCGFGIQLGGLASVNHLDCKDGTANNFDLTGIAAAASSGRRLAATTPSETERVARCSIGYGMDWRARFPSSCRPAAAAAAVLQAESSPAPAPLAVVGWFLQE